jgi:undecaprenyl diphosphate synthase
VIGEMDRLDKDIQEVLNSVLKKLSNNTGLQLTFALSYGARMELARAARLFAEDCLAGRAKPELMSEEVMEKYLWTSEIGDLAAVDLFIRTSGEQRVSNFLLWQSAYAEFVFVDTCWPDFSPKDLRAAIVEYSQRERRFGSIGKASLKKAVLEEKNQVNA